MRSVFRLPRPALPARPPSSPLPWTGEPARRAHRLQPGLRPADRHSAADYGRAVATSARRVGRRSAVGARRQCRHRRGQVHSYRLGEEAPRHDFPGLCAGGDRAAPLARPPPARLRSAHPVGGPLGSGLSSSAALLVALFRAFARALPLTLSDREIARLSQRVENDFVARRSASSIRWPAGCVSRGRRCFWTRPTCTTKHRRCRRKSSSW